jgi:enoyl-CoA hydratase
VSELYDLRGVLDVAAVGSVRIVTLNRPDKHNAVDGDLHWALASVWRRLVEDRECDVVIVTGAGDAFCAGGDREWIQCLNEGGPELEWTMHEAEEIVSEMLRFPKPVIAAVNGPAVGLGCSLALLCDLVFLADDAFLRDPHTLVGLVAGDGGLMLPLVTGLLRAKEMLLTGARISAGDALAWGLANRVLPKGAVLTAALSTAQEIAAHPQQAVRDTKRAINAYAAGALGVALRMSTISERQSFPVTGLDGH